MLIGLMGKSGSGKSIICSLLKELNDDIQVIDVDKIGHASHNDEEVRMKLLTYFGECIFNEDGSVNRKTLGSIVFSDDDKMKLLYDATYDYMVKVIDNLIDKADITILDYALIPKTKYYELCDLRVLIEAPYNTRSLRVLKRDNISEEKYAIRDANSVDYTKYNFNCIIQNTSDIDSLRKAVGEFYDKNIVSRKF